MMQQFCLVYFLPNLSQSALKGPCVFTGGQVNHCAWPFGWQDHRHGHILGNMLFLNPTAPQLSLYCNSCQVQREQPSKRWPQTRGHRSTWILSRSQAKIHEGLCTHNYFHFTHLIRRRKGSGHYNSGSCCERTCQGEKCNIAKSINPIVSSYGWQKVYSLYTMGCAG